MHMSTEGSSYVAPCLRLASLTGVQQEASQQIGGQLVAATPIADSRDPGPAEHRNSTDDPEAVSSHGPTTSASGMSLQPPSLPAHFSQQQPAMPAQLVAGSVQAQQQAAAAAAVPASPREAGVLGLAGQKQAPKPPLAPGSKSVPQVQSFWRDHSPEFVSTKVWQACCYFSQCLVCPCDW